MLESTTAAMAMACWPGDGGGESVTVSRRLFLPFPMIVLRQRVFDALGGPMGRVDAGVLRASEPRDEDGTEPTDSSRQHVVPGATAASIATWVLVCEVGALVFGLVRRGRVAGSVPPSRGLGNPSVSGR